MAVEITGISGSNAARVRRWCEDAFAALGCDADLQVEVSGWGRPRVVASAGDGGVWLHRGLLDDADLRLGFIVYEEVAHVVLARAGVPNDNRDTTESFWQELFATYVQLEALSKRTDHFDTWPVPPESPLGNLGKQIPTGHRDRIRRRLLSPGWPTTYSGREMAAAIFCAITATVSRVVSNPARSGRIPLYSLTCSNVTP